MAAKQNWCYYIPREQALHIAMFDGYIPSIVWADRPGHMPMKPDSEDNEPWVWGATLFDALKKCKQVNKSMGLSQRDCIEICESSQKLSAFANMPTKGH